jgi:CRISPR-associated protein Cas1
VTYSDDALILQRPDLTALPRIGDRIAFLFLDQVRVEQGRTGLEAWECDATTGQPLRISIPVAQLAVLCLGPGTSITGPAMTTLYRSGTSLIITGADGVVATAAARPLATDGRWATAQARLHTDKQRRLAAARTLYQARFTDQSLPDNLPLASLRGMEGHRVKTTYRMYANRYKHPRFKRVTVGATDPVNICLNRANSILYGVALAVTNALGLSPALGIIHQGTSSAFLYDLADVYKTTVSIPAAFEAAAHPNPGGQIGKLVRARLHEQHVLPNMLALTEQLLAGVVDDLAPDSDLLLDDDGYVPGLTNWALA